MEHVDGGAQLVAARDRAVAAVVDAFGRGRIGDDDCARLLDEVQAAPDVESLDRVVQRLGPSPTGSGAALRATRALCVGDLLDEAPSHPTTSSPRPTRALDAVDLALAARAGSGTRRRADPRLVALVVMAVVLVVLAVLGIVLIGAVRTDIPGSSSGSLPAPGAVGAPAPS